MLRIKDNPLIGVFLFVLVVIGLYSNTLSAPFHYDDYRYIVTNGALDSGFHMLRLWQRLEPAFRKRVVAFFTFALNDALAGETARAYRVVNIILHGITAFLVWVLTVVLFRTPRLAGSALKKYAMPIGLTAGLLFLVHPLQTESVTYISQRFTSLAGFFYCSALISYITARVTEREGAHAAGWYILAFACMGAGLFTKEIVFTLPLAVLMTEVVLFGNREPGRGPNRAEWRRIIAAGLIFISVLTLFVWAFHGQLMRPEARRVDPVYFFTQMKVLPAYLRLTFFPVGQNIDHHVVPAASLTEPLVMGGGLFLIMVCAGAAFAIRRMPLVGWGILFFFIAVSLESSLIATDDMMVEHRMYLPLIGLCIATSAGMCRLFKRPVPFLGVSSLIILALAAFTVQRNTVWQSAESLWSDAIRKAPGKVRPYINRGIAYARQGALDEAREDFERAIDRDPANHRAYMNRGLVFQQKGQSMMALADYEKSIALRPDNNPVAYNNKGSVLRDLGLRDKARKDFSKAIAQDSRYAEAYYNRGLLFMDEMRYDEALRDFERASRYGDLPGIEGLKKLARQMKRHERKLGGN